MNICPNPSLEDAAPPPTLIGSAQIFEAGGFWPDGVKGLVLTGAAPSGVGGVGQESIARWTLDSAAGMTGSVSMMAALLSSSGAVAPLSARVLSAEGAVLATFSLTSGAPSFALWAAGNVVMLGPDSVLEVRCMQPATGGAQWAVDEIEVLGPDGGAMARHKHEARVALINLVASLNGSPYWTNLEGRVFTKLRTPPDLPATPMPFAIVRQPIPSKAPLLQVRSEREWRYRIHVYFAEDRDDRYNSAAAEMCDKFEDDLVRLFLANPDLDGHADELEIENIYPFYGEDDARNYAEVVADVIVRLAADEGSLGPTAP